MRAIAIDPMQRLVLEVEFDGTDEGVADFIGASEVEAAFVFENGDVLLVDAEAVERGEAALVGREDAQRAFSFDIGTGRVFLGPAVVVGPRRGRVWSDVGMDPGRLASIAFDGPDAAIDEPGGWIN